MILLKGKSVVEGTVIGELYFLPREERLVEKRAVADLGAELARFEAASGRATAELEELYEENVGKLGEESAQIFQIHAMMVADEDFRDAVIAVIKGQRSNAEYAVSVAANQIAEMLRSSGAEYIGERGADIRDVAERLIDILSNGRGSEGDIPPHAVLAAEELSPSQVARLDMSKVLAIVTRQGSASAHAAIIARSLGIPAVICVGVGLLDSYAGMTAIVDGASGEVLVNPDAAMLKDRRARIESERLAQDRLRVLVGAENRSVDGRSIEIHANIGKPSDLDAVLKNDAGGIGLFRSEFLFLERRSLPTEDEQFEAYKAVLERMKGKRVIIRTLDIGADKKLDYLGLPEEANPALGLRAIRLCLARPDIFRVQLKALLRASAYGRLGIMFPMIVSVQEVLEAKAFVSELEAELDSEGTAYDKGLEIGIMVETPSAAIISDKLAAEVDFFSIGTNDLTQYTLAVDRENGALSSYYNPKHEAVLRLIEMTIKNAHAHGIWAGICGEFGADLSMTEAFLRLGVDELSVAPSRVLPLRNRVREIDLRHSLDERETGSFLRA